MANDRDNRKKHTPPAGVKKQIASDPEFEWEDLTPPIGNDVNELQQINVRAKNASSNAKAAFRMISEVKRDLEVDRIERETLKDKLEGVSLDVRSLERKYDDHAERLVEFGDKVGAKFDEQNTRLTRVGETAAGLTVAVGMLADQVKEDRAERQLQKQLEAQTDAEQRLIRAKTDAEHELVRAKTEAKVEEIETQSEAEHSLIRAKTESTVTEYKVKDETADKEHRRKWRRRILWAVTSVASAGVVHLLHTC